MMHSRRFFSGLRVFPPLLLAAALLSGCTTGGLMGGGADPTQTASIAATPPPATAPQAVAAAPLPALATECPPIKVRPGGQAMFSYGDGRAGNAADLHYQAVIETVSRNCLVSNGLITVRMGVVGRLLLGPKGSESSVNLPVRFAVERDGAAVFTEKYSVAVAVTPPNQSGEFVKVIENVAIPYVGGESITIWVGFDTRT